MAKVELGWLFDDDQNAMLRALIGSTLESYEGYAPFDESFFRTVRVRTDAGTIDLVNEHTDIPVGADFEEKPAAVLRVSDRCSKAVWAPQGKSLTLVDVGAEILDVLVVVDTILLTKGSLELSKLMLVQAVVFELPQGLLAVDREIWTDEYLRVHTGERISEVTRDHRGDWIVEPPHSYKFERNILRLSQPH